MNYEFFISKRISKGNKKAFSKPIINLAILSVSLGLALMLISISVVTGFQSAVKDKVAGFHSHIQISKFDFNESYELPPISLDSAEINEIKQMQGVKSISPFALKGGIIKTDDYIHGIVFKGIDKEFNWRKFNDWIIKGDTLDLNSDKTKKDILISKKIANKLELDTGMSFLVYFIQKPPRVDKYTIKGIYQSGFEEYDDRFIFGDIRKIKKLNKWEDNQVAGYEIMLDSYDNIDQRTADIYKKIDYDLKAKSINARFPFIMEWLDLLDTNVYFIIGLMIIISGITMIATLLILILERTNMIGILKALGARNKEIQKIFIYQSLNIIIKGLIFGNLFGIGFILLQHFFEIIPLNPETYYVTTVPVDFNIIYILLLNLGVIALITFMMLWPSMIISRIKPVKAIKFS